MAEPTSCCSHQQSLGEHRARATLERSPFEAPQWRSRRLQTRERFSLLQVAADGWVIKTPSFPQRRPSARKILLIDHQITVFQSTPVKAKGTQTTFSATLECDLEGGWNISADRPPSIMNLRGRRTKKIRIASKQLDFSFFAIDKQEASQSGSLGFEGGKKPEETRDRSESRKSFFLKWPSGKSRSERTEISEDEGRLAQIQQPDKDAIVHFLGMHGSHYVGWTRQQ